MRISREKVNHISKKIIENLEKRDDFDYKAELNEIRLEITHVMNDFLKIEINDLQIPHYDKLLVISRNELMGPLLLTLETKIHFIPFWKLCH